MTPEEIANFVAPPCDGSCSGKVPCLWRQVLVMCWSALRAERERCAKRVEEFPISDNLKVEIAGAIRNLTS
jgi:hypothetical protein